jgi:hypothetical protein
MAGCGRRLALRALVAWCAAAIAFSATTVVSQAAGNQLKIALQVGYHNTVKLGQWMPVAVDITNSGPDLDGTLEIQTSNSPGGGPPIGTAVYQAPVSLAAGASKHFRTYVTQDFPGTVQARVVQNGREVASEQVSSGNTITGLLVGILSDQPSTLDGFAIARPGGSPLLVVHLTAADLSDSAPVLRAFDVLAIDDFATDTLTAAQKAAFTDYVMQGGALLLGTGGSWHKTLAGLPPRIVPMNVTGSTVLVSAGALGGASGVEVATGTLAAGSRAWLAEGTRPLLIEEPTGKGIVEMSTFDWAQDSIATSSRVTALLRQVLVRMTYGNTSAPTATGPMMAKFGMGTSIATKGGALSQALGNLPALDLPAWWLIGALVLVYVLLVGPVNYFVLRAVGHRALAWITVPAIALVASGGAYGASVITKGTSVLANEVSIIHVQPGWDRAYQEEYTGILAPTRGDYEVTIGSGHPLVSPIYYYTPLITDPNFAAMRVNTTTDAISLPGMSAFTLRGFANEAVLGAAPQLTGQVQLTQGQLTGTIKNVSSMQFTDGVVLAGNSFQKLGKLVPGDSSSFSLQPSSTNLSGMPAYASIYSNNYGFNGYGFNGPPPSNTSDAERQNQMRSAILQTLMGNMYGGMPVLTQPTVVLWTGQPFQNVTVNGGHPRIYSESAVVMTLPVGQIGTGRLPAGVVPGRMVDLDADTSQGGPPGMVIAQSGSITFSFAPLLAPGTHLGSVSISSQNPYGPKFMIGPNGGAATVKGQVWDWSRSAWVDVGYDNSSLTLVPDGAINPTTGEVRFKLSSDGQFAAGSLSLSGSVD